MKHLIFLLSLSIILFTIISCEETFGPNELGGDTNLDLTEVGSEFGIYPKFENGDPALNNALSQINDTVYITKNENGIVTLKMKFETNIENFRKIDTMIGTYLLPQAVREQIFDYYKTKYDVEIDTSDYEHLWATKDVKLKITSDGIQDYVYSKGDESKPYTIMKYDSKVGDKYEFTDSDGEKITRTVTQTHQTEDWQIGFIMVKTMRVEQETPNDPLVRKITYIGNHKFGLVGIIMDMKDGKLMQMTIVPWNVM
ncbi:MAG: hypothetical protein A2X64_02825 [Ignavibacteria bacterium GWF2_33_9]|nr:MAG: hypothetical protein A2X64_02825 [Ignavibacteria bacterium GWF2_33_9]